MKRKKALLSLLCAVLAAVFSANCILAAPASRYTETELPFHEANLSSGQISNLFARPNGTISYFEIADKDGQRVAPKQFESTDSGKTWKQVDMSWYADVQKRYPQFGDAWNFYLAENGTIYCIVNTDKKMQEENGRSEKYNLYALYTYADGKVRQIPNVSFGTTGGPRYTILNVSADGDILIQDEMGPRDPISYLIYGPDGKLKKKTEITSHKGWRPTHYANNAVYGLQYYKDKPNSADALDVLTGEKVVSVPLPAAKSDDRIERLGVAKNGTMFLVSEDGLFRCAPGENSFTLVLGASGCRLGNNAAFDAGIVCLDDGNIYVPTYYFNQSNPDDLKNMGEGKLYRYSPAQ